MTVTQRLQLPIGEGIADTYRITGVLGYGGMAEVYEAEEIALGRTVAIKVATDPQGALLLRREAQALAAVRHRGLPTVYRCGAHRGIRYIALERLRGVTLDAYLARIGRASVADALSILGRLAAVLGAVHRAGMAHRDLKPGNVMLCADDRVVLLDFGIAVPEVDRSYREGITGTPRYLAPEAIRGAIAAGQAYRLDIYAFGVVAFELLAGQPPFLAPSLPELLERHLGDPVPDLARIRSEVASDLVALIEACLAKNPDDRPVSMEQIAWELQGSRRRSAPVPTGRNATRMPALEPPVGRRRTPPEP